MQKRESVLEDKMHKILRYLKIKYNPLILARRSDLVFLLILPF